MVSHNRGFLLSLVMVFSDLRSGDRVGVVGFLGHSVCRTVNHFSIHWFVIRLFVIGAHVERVLEEDIEIIFDGKLL